MFGFYFKLQNIVLLISSLFVALLQDPGQRSKPLPLFILLEEDLFLQLKYAFKAVFFNLGVTIPCSVAWNSSGVVLKCVVKKKKNNNILLLFPLTF